MCTYRKSEGPLWGAQKSTLFREEATSSGESHLFAANVYPQDELRGVRKDELSP